jgi:hypothetical protein
MLLAAQTTIIVKVIDQEPTTGFNLADVLIRALGVTGVLIVGSLILGLALGGGFIWYRVRQRQREAGSAIGSDLRVTPGLVEYAARQGRQG